MNAEPPLWFAALLALCLAGSAWVWLQLLRAWRLGQPAVAYRRRRPVPWSGADLLFLMMLFVLVPSGLIALFDHPRTPAESASSEPETASLPPRTARSEDTSSAPWELVDNAEARATLASPAPNDLKQAHPLVQLLAARRSATTVGLAMLAGVFAAPLAEELAFRVFLQGWLETRRRRWFRGQPRRAGRRLAWWVPAALFALLHLRGPAEEADLDPQRLQRLLIANLAGGLLASALAVWWARNRCGATWADLGLARADWQRDVQTGFAGFLVAMPVVYSLQMALENCRSRWWPDVWAVDPIPLLVLASVLGYLYHRTGRLAAPLTMHAAFNGFSLLLLFAASG